MILGITDAMRREELHNLEIQCVPEIYTFYLVGISKTKSSKAKQFVVNMPCTFLIKKYIDLRPKNKQLFFKLSIRKMYLPSGRDK